MSYSEKYTPILGSQEEPEDVTTVKINNHNCKTKRERIEKERMVGPYFVLGTTPGNLFDHTCCLIFIKT